MLCRKSPFFVMHVQDDPLRALQRQNDHNAWLEYERRLTAAYARSQDPHPGKRWMRSHPGGRVRWNSEFDALG